MSITDELREWASGSTLSSWTLNKLIAIADRIDAEHETTELQKESYRLDLKAANIAVGEAYKRGYDEGFAIADDWLAQHEDAMAEHGWVRLPKDADGEYIHSGDVMENLREDLEPQLHHTFRVYSIQYRDYEQVCKLTEDGYPTILYRANECRHYHAPTVEDVLREFTDAVLEWAGKSGAVDEVGTWSDVAADFAAKLQLRGDAE